MTSLQLIEEAFHLLRTASSTTLLLNFLGTVPLACLLFYYWADMSHSRYADRDSVVAALVLGIAFFWKCSFQAAFCRRLWEQIHPGQIPRQRGWQAFRYHAALWCFHALAIPVLVLAICFVLPLCWMIASLHNATVLALTQDYGTTALRRLTWNAVKHSHHRWAQNVAICVTMGFIGFFAWLNVVAACSLVPLFGKMFFGIESQFTINAEALFNSTFLFGTVLIAHLGLSPLIKAIYVLRCFYAESRVTGADLLSRLAGVRRERRRPSPGTPRSPRRKVAALLAGFLVATTGAAPLSAEDALPPPGPDRETMDRAIRDAMAAKKYQWKLSRDELAGNLPSADSWLQRQLTQIADSVDEQLRRFRAWLKKRADAIWKRLRENQRQPRPPREFKGFGEGFAQSLNSALSVALVVLVTGLVGWFVWVLVKHYRPVSRKGGGDATASGDVDLESEELVASQLPEDEWMKMAREQMARGESRLAIRALYLATLAHLGERGLLRIQKHKSNRDYRGELALRARQRTRLREAFRENTGLFERAWYGLHAIGEEAVRHFMENYEIITGDSA